MYGKQRQKWLVIFFLKQLWYLSILADFCLKLAANSKGQQNRKHGAAVCLLISLLLSHAFAIYMKRFMTNVRLEILIVRKKILIVAGCMYKKTVLIKII